ncbi:MAG: hypothetical protein PHO75_00680 [Candidatus Shapirobacteria bacterium]|jgi:hypothetical protein|nr:hypothetical protein [Candidatus Shapirobacteria bacterium]
MINFLNKYLGEINQKLEGSKKENWESVLKHHRETIKFLQHERLIHLLVTLAFAIKFIVVMMFTLIYPQPILLVIDGLLLVLLVPYIFHYFKLENGVQKLYWIDKLIRDIIKA